MKRTISILALLLALNSLSVANEPTDLRRIIEHLHDGGEVPFNNQKVHLKGLMIDLYSKNEFQTIWNDDQQVMKVIYLLENAVAHGLVPNDYHVDFLLENLEEREGSERVKYYFDLLLSDGVLLYSHHLTTGRLQTNESRTWNYPARSNVLADLDTFLAAVNGKNLPDYLNELIPEVAIYSHFMSERAKLASMLENEGELVWIPDHKVLHKGDSSAYVSDISNRIAQLGFGSLVSTNGAYSAELEQQVKQFQKYHGIDQDGIIGKGTYEMLNLSLTARIELLDINMERIRWLSAAKEDNMIVVNIPGFHLFYFRDNEVHWHTDVMTGAIDTQTPIFGSEMKYLVFNPTWTVPRSIINKSLFERIKNDPEYMQTHNFTLQDHQGNVVERSTINWDEMTLNKFNYTVVQGPGTGNALGRVKFIFPNKYAIYLHDTPSKYLFSRSSRAFSHGCIRVKDPMRLAEILLDNQKGYTQKDIDAIVATGETKVVYLKQPLRVVNVYLTVDGRPNEPLYFHKDVYNMDARLKQRFKTEFGSQLN
ncbi:murein L,D-transpeptidase YcbB/YkuD [Roseivirga pacifica]|uniref:Murein L,D-transpeptidase YcbB/YkuD n=1 Tax=Roseivirga pacifica TaxID=1267423 RepID=A0A1I0R8Q4_9BACT|nr:L,D-transpeptidase family protein [Roseivirga pacifica]RKQ49228.1 murein L,D-transpeptidase YcbB/YkuD [Roseivirga pacifica]SEW37164.1 Murein L,D-transpeptidase YcbB/YkuD [Roseivirga pacifica]